MIADILLSVAALVAAMWPAAGFYFFREWRVSIAQAKALGQEMAQIETRIMERMGKLQTDVDAMKMARVLGK